MPLASPTLTGVGDALRLIESVGFASALDLASTHADIRALHGVHTFELDPLRAGVFVDTSPGVHRVDVRDRFLVNLSPGRVRLQHTASRPYDKDSGAALTTGQPGLFDVTSRCALCLELCVDACDHCGECSDCCGCADESAGSRSVITEWSRKSRRNMVGRLADLDLSEWVAEPGNFAFVTLTMPGEWEHLAPTGAAFKGYLERLRARWIKAGQTWRVIWKLELQERGAPHYHLMLKMPHHIGAKTADIWLRDAWVDIVGADDSWCHRCLSETCDCVVPDTERRRHRAAHNPQWMCNYSVRLTDPKRVAVYFLKHGLKSSGAKEYQHRVPDLWQAPGAGPGRFWGYSGLKPAVEAIEVSEAEFYRARRILRGVARSRAASHALKVRAARLRDLEHVSEPLRRSTLELDVSTPAPLRHGRHGGWVLVNDTQTLTRQLIAATVYDYQISRSTRDLGMVNRAIQVARQDGDRTLLRVLLRAARRRRTPVESAPV
jgi:hypothetical protein